mgnify:CR=1 FL=1
MVFRLFKRREKKKPSIRKKTVFSLGTLAVILVLSGVIAILEYRRISDYVSDLISSNIKSIALSQQLSDITEEYNHQMLAVVIQNDLSLMPDFNKDYFMSHSDTLKNSITAESTLPVVQKVDQSFDHFILTSQKFDEVFLADNVNTGEWFFGTLQPSYNKFRQDMAVLNEMIHAELTRNSADIDAGFYRSIIPGVVSVGAGLILILLLLFFTLVNYVRPIYRMVDGINSYRTLGRRYTYDFDGDDQLAEINTGVTEIIEENLELKTRIKALRENLEKTNQQ